MANQSRFFDDNDTYIILIPKIRSQAPKHSANLPSDQWRAFEAKLAEQTVETENKVLELGHFEQALDDISEWTSRCSSGLSGIGRDFTEKSENRPQFSELIIYFSRLKKYMEIFSKS